MTVALSVLRSEGFLDDWRECFRLLREWMDVKLPSGGCFDDNDGWVGILIVVESNEDFFSMVLDVNGILCVNDDNV